MADEEQRRLDAIARRRYEDALFMHPNCLDPEHPGCEDCNQPEEPEREHIPL
jgi:hypothetical protein